MRDMEKAQEKSKKSIEDRKLVSVLQDMNATSRQREAAFNSLYSRHEANLMFYFLKKVKNSDEAKDLKMVTFEKVHKNIDSYDDKFAFSTWMYKIAINSLIDHMRKSSCEVISLESLSRVEESGYLEFQLESDSLNPEEIISRNERVEIVKKSISSIDNKFIRDLMSYRYINQLSFSEISNKMGIEDESKLRVGVFRGKKILKEKLRGVNPFA